MKTNKIFRKELICLENIIVAIAFLFFMFTMLNNLMNSSLGGDEWVEYNVSIIRFGSGDFYKNVASTFQPPLYNVLTHYWMKFNRTVEWFRLFNIGVGVVSGAFYYLTINKMYGKKWAAGAMVALATCNQWVYCIQECSEYALMLMFVFIALFYFISLNQKYEHYKLILFILASVGAIYSQYGSVFVIVPLLVAYAINRIFIEKKNQLQVVILYFGALVLFAVPLYVFFLSKQLANNQISENSIPITNVISVEMVEGFGRIIGFLYALNNDSMRLIWTIFGLLLMAISVIIFIQNKDVSKRIIIISLWVAYTLHYTLTSLHIYAMVHPGESLGMYCRYSYFYIPLLAVVVPILLHELLYSIAKEKVLLKVIYSAIGIALCCVMVYSFVYSFRVTLLNWHKAYDKEFAEIWMREEGYNEKTYICGPMTDTAYKYYASHMDGFKGEYVDNVTMSPEFDKLPDSFWVWRSQWNGDNFYEIIQEAENQGYDVYVYLDAGYSGQFAHCTK